MKDKPNNRYSERLRRYAAAENKMLLGTEAKEIADYLDAVTDMADDLKTIEMFMELGRQEKKLVRNVVASLWTPEEKKKTVVSEIVDTIEELERELAAARAEIDAATIRGNY